MAVEIEKLIARLEADTKDLDASMQKALRKFEEFEKKGKKSTKGLGVAFSRLSAAISLVGTAVTTAIGFQGLRFIQRVERQVLRIDALLRSTGNTAGFTANELDRLARRIGEATLASPEQIRDAVGILLTFRRIQGTVFQRTIKLSQDLAEVMGTDVRQATLQLAKALEEPEIGLSFLRRSGVSFSEQEKQMIMDLQEANRAFDAQSLILDKVAKQVGGAGAGAASGLAGRIDLLGQRWNELTETVVESTGLQKLWSFFVDEAKQTVEGLDLTIRKLFGTQDEYQNRVEQINRANEGMADVWDLSSKRISENLVDVGPTTSFVRKQKDREKAVTRVIDRLKDERRSLALTDDELVAFELAQAGATRKDIERALALVRINQQLEKQAELSRQQARGFRGEAFVLGGVAGTQVSSRGGGSTGVQRVEDVGTRSVVQVLESIDRKLDLQLSQTTGAVAV